MYSSILGVQGGIQGKQEHTGCTNVDSVDNSMPGVLEYTGCTGYARCTWV